MRASSQVHKPSLLGWAAALLLVPVLATAQTAQTAPPTAPPPAPEQGAGQPAAPAAVPPAAETAAAPAPAAPAPAAPTPPTPPAGPAVRVLRTGGLKMETAALLLSGQQGGPLPFAVLAFPVTREGDMVRVPVLVEVDGAALLDEQQGSPLDLEVALYALGANGNVQAAVMETVEVDLDRMEAEVRRSGIKFFGELQLLPGDYSLRALVRNPATDNIGLRVVPLTVTGLDAEVRTVMAPMFAERAGAWLPVRALEMRGRSAPLAALAGENLPAARPILVPEQDVTFQVAAYHLQEGLDLRMELRRPSGQLAADFPLQITGRQPAGPPGLEILTASFKPHGVEPGEYDLRVVIPGAGNDFRSYPVSAVVAEQDVGGRVWAELSPSHKEERQAAAGAPGTPGAAPAAPHPPRPKARGRVDTTPMENAYRDALRLLGTGDEKGARAAVSTLETSVLVEQQTLSGPELGRAEYAVAHGLAQTQPEALIPVLLLHEQLYRDYLNRNVSMLYSHAREMTFILADLYVKQNNTPAARELAARFILGLASEFAVTAPRVVRSRAFRKVLDFDPGNEAALLCLAIDAERNAEYQAAVDYLGKLVQKNPKHAEGKVRLALNQARLGHRKDARRQFEEVLKDESGGEGAAPIWLLAVAYQELSRLLIDSEDYEAAERVLRAGLARLPEDEKLSLELALVLDQRKNRSESRAVLETVRPKTTPRGFDSARRRYTQLPVELLERERMGLQQSAAERLHSLAVAVPAGGAKGGLP